jgi:uncharacterized protein YukE
MASIPPEGFRWETKTIHPPEADEIASKLRLAASSLQSGAYFIGSVKGKLEQCWAGHSKDRFFEDYGFARLPRRLEDLGLSVDDHGKQIGRITVTVTERVPFETGLDHGR